MVTLELASSNRSRCRVCKGAILKDQFRFRVRVKVTDSFFRDMFRCTHCAPPTSKYMLARRMGAPSNN